LVFYQGAMDGKLIAIVLLWKKNRKSRLYRALEENLDGAYGTVRVGRDSSDTLEAMMLVATKRN